MKKGFSLIELVIVIALVGILLSIASLSTKNVLEKRALAEAEAKISTVLRLAGERSFNDGKVYTITLDYSSKNISVEDEDLNLEKSIELPEMLEYTTVEGGVKLSSKEAKTTAKGGMTSFSVYIFDTEGNVRYRISVDGINASGLSYVNVYRNTSASATWDNITTYDYESNKGDWEKE